MTAPDTDPVPDDRLDEIVVAALSAEPSGEERGSALEAHLTPADRARLDARDPAWLDRLLAGEGRIRADRRIRPLRPRIAVAAALLLLVLLPATLLLNETPATLAGCVLEADPGARYEVLGPRRVRLEEGTLRLAASRFAEPLAVETPAGTAEAAGDTGAAFVVTSHRLPDTRGDDDDAGTFSRLLVLAGKVRFQAPLGIGYCDPGQILFAQQGEQPVVRTFGAPRGPWDGGLPITALAASSDGRRIVTGDDCRAIKIWDAEDGRLLSVLYPGHDETITALAIRPDGRTLASASQDATVRLWDLSTGARIRTLARHDVSANAVVWSADGKRLLTGGSDRTVRLWEADTGRLLRTVRIPAGGKGEKWTGVVTAVALAGGGRVAVAGDLGGHLSVVDLETGRLRRRVPVGGRAVYAVALTADGRTALAGSEDGTLSAWDLASGTRVRDLGRWGSPVSALALGPGGRRVLVSPVTGDPEVRDVAAGTRLVRFAGHPKGVGAAAFLPGGTSCVTGGRDGRIRLFDVETGDLLNPGVGTEDAVLPVRAIAFHPGGRSAALGREDGTILLRSVPGGEPGATLEGHEGPVLALAFGPDGERLLSGGGDGTVRLWETGTGKLVETFRGHTAAVRAVDISPDGALAASAGEDHAVRLWDLGRLHPGKVLEGHESTVTAVRFAPDGTLLSGDLSGRIRRWDVATGKTVWSDYVTEVAFLSFSRDGRRLLAPSIAFDHPDPGLHVWTLGEDRCVTIRPGEGRGRLSGPAVLTADGARVVGATGSRVRVWDVATKALLLTREDEAAGAAGPVGSVTAIAVSPDGRYAMVAVADRSVRLFDLGE